MKTNVQTITRQQLAELFNEYENDIYSNADEIWIGLKGTTTLKVIMDSDDLYLYEYGVTVQELRKDPVFFRALFTDGDVNHALSSDDRLTAANYNEIFKWYNGVTQILPVSPCGLVNFIDSYR